MAIANVPLPIEPPPFALIVESEPPRKRKPIETLAMLTADLEVIP